MPSIASRDLRNHTATVLDGVSRGEVYVVTVHGRPVAELRRVTSQRRSGVPVNELVDLLDRQRNTAAASGTPADPTLADDMAWISEGTTDDLDS